MARSILRRHSALDADSTVGVGISLHVANPSDSCRSTFRIGMIRRSKRPLALLADFAPVRILMRKHVAQRNFRRRQQYRDSFGTLIAFRAGQRRGARLRSSAVMPYGMYISAEGAAAQSQRLDVIANNLANVDTTGFKQDVVTFQARYSEAIQRGLDTPRSRSINDVGGGVKVIDTTTDFSAGQLKRTGNNLDFAINGNGFFHVRGKDGNTYLSRAGDFQIDADGRIVTQNDQHPVLDQNNREIILEPNVHWSASPDGFIYQDGDVYALGLSRPKSLNELVNVGQNMFRTLGKTEAVPLPERDVRQGYLEMSGANPVRQMMAMIETTRAFEANTRMIQNQDSAMGTLISRVLRS